MSSTIVGFFRVRVFSIEKRTMQFVIFYTLKEWVSKIEREREWEIITSEVYIIFLDPSLPFLNKPLAI